MVRGKGLSLKAVRRNCLECSGGTVKYVTWCACDGVHSTRCEFWPFRFGTGPDTVRRRFGPRLVTPEMMPDANTNLDELPAYSARIEVGVVQNEDPVMLAKLRGAREARERKRRERAQPVA
jgi:hypothetical protein